MGKPRVFELGDKCFNGHLITEETRRADGRCKTCHLESGFKGRVKKGIILPPDTPVTLKPYKEPLDPVSGGYGYYGTVAYNKEGTHLQCHICGYFFKNLSLHIPSAHKGKLREYKAEYGLSARRALVSEEIRAGLRARAMRKSPEEKQKSIERLLKYQTKRGETRNKVIRKPLEAKNREGRCPGQLLDRVEKLGKKLGKTPTMLDFGKAHGRGTLRTLTLTFGSWNQALSFAGFTPNGQSSRAGYDRETVITMIRTFYELEGRVPRSSDLSTELLPSQNTMQRLFGGLIKARQAAGFGQNDYIHEGGV